MSEENFNKSINYGLQKIDNLKKEIDLLQIEHEGLFKLANNMSEYVKVNLPHDQLNLNQNDLFFNWSHQITRYRAAATGVFEILQARQEEITQVISATASDMKNAGMEVPDELIKFPK